MAGARSAQAAGRAPSVDLFGEVPARPLAGCVTREAHTWRRIQRHFDTKARAAERRRNTQAMHEVEAERRALVLRLLRRAAGRP